MSQQKVIHFPAPGYGCTRVGEDTIIAELNGAHGDLAGIRRQSIAMIES
ncbi:MAG: hypothetical protein IH942_07795 [Acidobacteria bacterium]|nr:hypothetical protein [Acidobacteriota bacterium]